MAGRTPPPHLSESRLGPQEWNRTGRLMACACVDAGPADAARRGGVARNHAYGIMDVAAVAEEGTRLVKVLARTARRARACLVKVLAL